MANRATRAGLAPATINHLASLAAFTTWVQTQAPGLFLAAAEG